MGIDLVFITYNRLDYTKKSLASILADPTEEFNLYIWDNASTDGTREYLKDGWPLLAGNILLVFPLILYPPLITWLPTLVMG